ncbi:MAG TPA: penicillin-insensitive murein endopeptidase [Vicinamibacteria bacterium]|nr:penicillin-insensitive murein endopeptidase [Vicinamibacteria bacterium]
MRTTRPTPGTCAAALLAMLCAAGLPAPGADDPLPPALTPPDVATPDLPQGGRAREGDLAGFPRETEELLVAGQRDPAALGPLSIGTPDAGLLLNPVPFPEGSFWTVRDPRESWGTDETIGYVVTAIESVEARYPGSPRVVIGDLSNPNGGRLNRHRSHQTGRDADIGFYYRRGEVDTFVTARRKDLDLPRTWALVRALLTDTDVDRIFVDRSIISVLYAHALKEGEDRGWLDDVFGRSGDKGLIQHVRRHKDHLHVRFYNPRAQEQGRIAYPVLVETGAAPPPTVKHRVRRGETLGGLARRYGTSVSAIRAANGLRGTRLRAGRSYTIPIRRVPPDEGPVVVPPRRRPPAPVTTASAAEEAEVPSIDGAAAAQR